MKTINQINSFLERNQTIQHYFDCSADSYYYSGGYKAKSFNFLDGSGRPVRLTMKGNFLYGRALKYWCDVNRYPDSNNYSRDHRQEVFYFTIGSRQIEFTFSLKNDLNGIIITVQSNFKALQGKFPRYQVRSNSTWENFNLRSYCEKKIIPLYLYPAGLFHNIQICYNLEKKEVPAKYKEILKQWNDEPQPDYAYIFFKKQFKKLNIDISEIWEEKDLLKAWKQYKDHKPFKNKVRVCKFNPFELLDQLTGEFDQEDELMNEANNIINDPEIIWI